jgi:transcriptional regulator with XRE-family HTH domain
MGFNGAKIKELRKARGWTLAAVQAEWFMKFKTPITTQALSAWETGTYRPNYRNLSRLARLFETTEGYFFN